MSLTLPYSTAVNCKFVALPDELATTDNTLKLYNIDGSVPGGDSYTKAESDARYLKTVSATQQNVSGVVKFSEEPLFQTAFTKKLIFNRGIVIGGYSTDLPGITFASTNGNTVAATLFIPQLQYTTASILLDSPTTPQTVDRLKFLTGAFLKGATNSNYVQVTSADQIDNNKYVRVPILGAGCDMVVTNATTTQSLTQGLIMPTVAVTDSVYLKPPSTSNYAKIKSGEQTINNVTATLPQMTGNSDILVTNPTTTQTINGNLKVTNLQTTGWWNPINGGTTSIFVGMEQDDLTNNKIITIPKIAATTQFIVANPSTTQTVNGRFNVGSLGLNGNQITDLVTTIEASDAKIPTSKAVKTYVDERATSNLVDNSYTISSTTVTGPTIPSSTIFTTGYRKYCFSWNKDPAATGVKVLNTWTLPDDTFSKISIEGISHLQITSNSNVSHFKWTGAAILILGSATAAISSYANGNHWTDYDPGTTYPTVIAAGGKNVSLVLNCDSTGNRSKGVFTIETWNIGS